MHSFLVIQVPLKKRAKTEYLSKGMPSEEMGCVEPHFIKESKNMIVKKSSTTSFHTEKEERIIQGILECLKALEKLEGIAPKAHRFLDETERNRLLMRPAKGNA